MTIISEDDEPPLITNTTAVQFYREEGGPVSIVDPSVTIVDNDNCPDHTIVQEVLVTLENPVDGEDQFIVDGVISNYSIAYSCDVEVNATCFEDFLRTIYYNNTNMEPESFTQNRTVTIEVSGCLQLQQASNNRRKS